MGVGGVCYSTVGGQCQLLFSLSNFTIQVVWLSRIGQLWKLRFWFNSFLVRPVSHTPTHQQKWFWFFSYFGVLIPSAGPPTFQLARSIKVWFICFIFYNHNFFRHIFYYFSVCVLNNSIYFPFQFSSIHYNATHSEV